MHACSMIAKWVFADTGTIQETPFLDVNVRVGDLLVGHANDRGCENDRGYVNARGSEDGNDYDYLPCSSQISSTLEVCK